MPVLIVKFQGSVLQKVPTNGGSITIGRSPDNSIAIDNLAVSSRHAEIRSEEGHLVVEDLNSLNGTFVNNQRVKRSALKDGDVVLIGKHSIQVDEKGSGEAPIRNAGQPEQSYSERQIYQAALDRLVREFAAVEKIDENTAVRRVEQMLSAA